MGERLVKVWAWIAAAHDGDAPVSIAALCRAVVLRLGVELLEVDAAGLLLADGRGALRLVAASTEQARVAELFQIQNDEGPCVDCFCSGQAAIIGDISAGDVATRWPRFGPAALQMGFAGVHAIPMRLRDQVIGTLNLGRQRAHVRRVSPVLACAGQAGPG